MLEDVVDGLAEDVAVAAAGGAEDDDLRLPPVGLLDDRAARVPGAHDAVDHAHAVELGGRARVVEQVVGRELLVVHGSPKDPFEAISHDMEEEELRAMLADDPADIVVCGGTHVPFARVIDEVQLINVGSVGSAPEGRYAHYTIISPQAAGATFEQSFVEY